MIKYITLLFVFFSSPILASEDLAEYKKIHYITGEKHFKKESMGDIDIYLSKLKGRRDRKAADNSIFRIELFRVKRLSGSKESKLQDSLNELIQLETNNRLVKDVEIINHKIQINREESNRNMPKNRSVKIPVELKRHINRVYKTSLLIKSKEKASGLLLDISEALTSANEYDKSIEVLEAITENDNENNFYAIKKLALLAENYQKLNDVNRAKKTLEKLSIKHKSPETLNLLALFLSKQNKYNEALAIADESLEISDSEKTHAVISKIHTRMGWIHTENNNFDAAEEVLKKAMTEDFNNPSPAVLLTKQYLKAMNGDEELTESFLNKAKKHFMYTIHLLPNFPLATQGIMKINAIKK